MKEYSFFDWAENELKIADACLPNRPLDSKLNFIATLNMFAKLCLDCGKISDMQIVRKKFNRLIDQNLLNNDFIYRAMDTVVLCNIRDDWHYATALKMLTSLYIEYGNFSSILTIQHMFNRLMDKKPLSPIEDTDDIWYLPPSECLFRRDEDEIKAKYNCLRMNSLSKYVYRDGHIKYADIGYFTCINMDEPNKHNNVYSANLVAHIIYEMFPITMPYMPGEPIKVYCSERYDAVAIAYCIRNEYCKPEEKIAINRYFREQDEGCWIEISEEEFYNHNKGVNA